MLPNWCANAEEVRANQTVWRRVLADAERRSPRKETRVVFVSQEKQQRSYTCLNNMMIWKL